MQGRRETGRAPKTLYGSGVPSAHGVGRRTELRDYIFVPFFPSERLEGMYQATTISV